ncbi:GNAT family N-acetyltransferase [Sporosarcina sp. NCCP-2716]|uniref:GNAT family N-acetyltransferase n=1 Tax=Sporosarcina sp. NCCP-2716 TaxID=2943679 RepID=UPI002040C85A|nr:GNAT family N-acetyltransferase [Sporosarcina sp. NCCP-2716]
MDLSIHDVTASNYREILQLQVADSQKGFIETPYQCLEDSVTWKQFRPVGLYAGETLVGFAMYGLFEEEGLAGRLWIDRLLIDVRYQGQGYGKRFMVLLIAHVLEQYGQQPIYLSVYPDNMNAIRLYEQLGFSFTGELDEHGEHIMKKS